MIKQKFITFNDEHGLLNSVGIIHYVHDERMCTFNR